MNSQSKGQFPHTLISNWIVIDSELNNITSVMHEHFPQKLAPQCCNLIVHQIQEFNGVDFLNVVANGSDPLILKIYFPEPDPFEVGVLELCKGLHKRANLQGTEFLPELELDYKKNSTV